MNFFSLLSSDSAARLMITFGHCLWQGLAITIVATIVARQCCRRNPNLRYTTYLAALVLLVACLPVTYLLVSTSSDLLTQPSFEGQFSPHFVQDNQGPSGSNEIIPLSAGTIGTELIPPDVGLRSSDAPQPSGVLQIRLQQVTEWTCWVYLAGVLLMLARLGVSLYGAHRISRDTIPVESSVILGLLDSLVRELGIRAAPTLAWSRHIVAPAVIGIIRPTILLPFSLATALSSDELSSILAHELAHIRRNDLWFNLFQRFAEAILFFHPAVWFLSRRLSAEREYCCDDVAVSRGLGSIRYAELLVRLAEVRCRVPLPVEQQVALAAAGDRPSQLRRRVARLFGLEEELTMKLTRRGAMTLAATFLMAATLFAVSVPAESPNNTDRQVSDTTVHSAENADADKGQPDSKLSETERALVGTWSRVSFLSETKLIFTANRSYHYEYSLESRKSRTGEIPKGEWRIENGTELVYLRRNSDGSVEETPARSRVVSINEKELKLQLLSPAGDGKVYTFTHVAEAGKLPTRTAATPPKRAEATISGRLVYEDGSTDRKGWLYSHSTDGNSTSFSTEGQYTDRFSIQVPVGTVWLKYFPDEYAPAWLGPIQVKDGDTINDVQIVVKNGYASTLRVEDNDHHPIAGATFVPLPEIGGNTNGPVVELKTDALGEVTLKHVAEVPYAFHVEAPGYEPLRSAPRQLSSGSSTLKMTRSQPTTGTVLSADGTPAKNAKLQLLFEVYPDGDVSKNVYGRHTRYGRVMATTDESGRFTLDQLISQARHVFLVETADRARVVIHDLHAGQRDMLIDVPKRRDLRVQIVGDLNRLPKRSLKPYIDVRQDVEPGADSRHLDLIAEMAFVTPTEEGGVAEYRGLVAGEVKVRVGNRTWTSEVADSGTTEVEVDLGGTTELNPDDKAASGRESNGSAATPRTPAISEPPPASRDPKQKAATATPIPLGKVVEITVNDDNPKVGDFLLDFETGRLFSIPKEYREGHTEPPAVFEKWIVPNGIDAIGETKNSVRGLFGLDLVAIPIDGPADKLPEIPANRLSSQFVDSIPGRPVPISGKGELPATYLFQTREGSRGVLQIVGFADEPRGVKIRYKLLSLKLTPAAPAESPLKR